ncbi:MAG: transposase, partial [Atopobium sp.]|nr:transposase [Atopobium sp.]
MYSIQTVQISQSDDLYAWCDTVTHLANNLENAALFRIRQCMTAVTKKPSKRTDNEKEVLQELELLCSMSEYQMPEEKKWMLSYKLLDALFKMTHNPDYYAEGLPRQTAQNAVKTVVRNMKSFFQACKAYAANPEVFTGKPKLPKYHRSGGTCTALLSNQDCVVKDGIVKLPKTRLTCRVGEVNGRLKQAVITPYHDVFVLSLTLETEAEPPEPTEHPARIVSLDLGVDNLAAMTNNTGRECLLFKGGIVKSINQLYNKRIAAIVSKETKGTNDKFIPTAEYHAVTLKRNRQIDDFFHKTAKMIMTWCLDNRIDTIVIGHNRQWKQESAIG